MQETELMYLAMAMPVRGNYRGLAARIRLVVVLLASAMMITGLSCSLALYAIEKTGQKLTRSSFSLLHSWQRSTGYLEEHLLAVLCVLVFFTLVCTMFGEINIWHGSRGQAGSHERSGEVGEKDEVREDELTEWDLEEGSKPATLKELSTRHIWDPETGTSIKLPKWGIVP